MKKKKRKKIKSSLVPSTITRIMVGNQDTKKRGYNRRRPVSCCDSCSTHPVEPSARKSGHFLFQQQYFLLYLRSTVQSDPKCTRLRAFLVACYPESLPSTTGLGMYSRSSFVSTAYKSNRCSLAKPLWYLVSTTGWFRLNAQNCVPD